MITLCGLCFLETTLVNTMLAAFILFESLAPFYYV